ncbi:hypothetical protein NI389_03430 [Pseudoalteromonas xiamenensis]|nr:hypothetical protein NI389_03430 [Pseudoalteromonas xiamenensis]
MRGYNIKTEKTDLYWNKAFINFHHKRHPETMGAENVRALSINSVALLKLGQRKLKKLVKIFWFVRVG